MQRASWIAAVVAMLVTPSTAMAADSPYTGAGAENGVCFGYEELLFCGELNGDCKVTAVDALLGLKMAVGQVPIVQEADMDQSGGVTAPDALKVLRIAVGSSPASYDCDPGHIVLNATASGFYKATGVRTPDNYAVGWYTGQMEEIRDYFVFDLSSVELKAVSAKLRLTTVRTGQSLYLSKDPSETFQLVHVDTPVDALTNGTGGMAAFTDLADGTVYASRVVAPLGLTMLLEVPLNDAGLAAVLDAEGLLAFGGSITTLAKGGTGEYLFNSTRASDTRQLILTLPVIQ